MNAIGNRVSVVVGCIVVALAVAGPASATGKLAATEAVGTDGALTVSFNEPSQKKFASVSYRLAAEVAATWACPDGSTVGTASSSTATTTVVPGGNGHALGSVSLDAPTVPSSTCTQQLVLQQVDYTNVLLTNLATGHVYPLDSISRSFP